MKITNNIEVPTGNIYTGRCSTGHPIEFLSIGDYGKEKNLKADFLGLTKEINGVEHGEILPLEEKWVITISSQHGCSMDCKFCDVPKVGKGRNVAYKDLINQVMYAVNEHPEIKQTERLNLHYARMGEPTWNNDIFEATYKLKHIFDEKGWGFHPVISTMMPEGNPALVYFIDKWLQLKKHFKGEAGLQISINTTNQAIRRKTMPHSRSIEDISEIMQSLTYGMSRVGRKITLNFALTDADVDAEYLAKKFNPEHFLCKLTPMHMTTACRENNYQTENGYSCYYPYREVEENLKKAGFDVIVFIPSIEEDVSKITCGNAVLSTQHKTS